MESIPLCLFRTYILYRKHIFNILVTCVLKQRWQEYKLEVTVCKQIFMIYTIANSDSSL